MSRPCSIAGCRSSVTARYSPLCSAHRKHLARHGHPLQSAVLPRELAPFLRLIQRRQADNADSPAWVILRGRWSRLLEWATATAAAADAGKAYSKVPVRAARLLLGVGQAVDPDTVSRTAMAVVMYRQATPHRFKDDRAVLFQVARQLLRLAPQEMGKTWDQKRQAVRTVRRDHPPRVLELIGQQLVDCFGGAAAQLHHIERTRRSPEQIEAERLTSALSSLRAKFTNICELR